jgi:ribosome-associated translation inhibitor RaiA
MNIVFHAHHAELTERVQRRAERTLTKLAARLRGADASVRLVGDGPLQRVEVELRPPRRRALVAIGEGRRLEAALADAMTRLESHVAHARDARDRRIRHAMRGSTLGLSDAGRALLRLDREAHDDGGTEERRW